jgi:uncharacterized protein YjbJ (UPF0337 family)
MDAMIAVDVIEGYWMELRCKIKQRWGKITDDDLDGIEGKREQLVSLLQQKYGFPRESAEKEIDQFLSRVNIE